MHPFLLFWVEEKMIPVSYSNISQDITVYYWIHVCSCRIYSYFMCTYMYIVYKLGYF